MPASLVSLKGMGGDIILACTSGSSSPRSLRSRDRRPAGKLTPCGRSLGSRGGGVGIGQWGAFLLTRIRRAFVPTTQHTL